MAKFCTNCGKEIPEGVAFCTECGTKASEPKAATEQPAEAVAEKAPEAVIAENTQPAAQQTAAPQPQATYQAPPQQGYQQQPPQAPPAQNYGQPQYQQPYTPPPTQPIALTAESVKGTKYEPISAWGFIGIMLLMCIPVVGLILTIVWACGGCRKICKRSLARAAIIMTVIGIVIGIIFALVGGALINSLLDKAGIDTNGEGIFSGLSLGSNEDENEKEKSGGLLGLFGGSEDTESSDYSELGQLGEALGTLEALAGLTGGESGDLSGLFGNIEDINAQAEAKNNGWPKALRKYPGGTQAAVASYRTEISDTSEEEMLSWINGLKSDGYKYTDFYGFGMSEEDMLSSGGWWGTNGTYYISVSYYDGTVTVDHLTELPDLESYFN